MSENKKIRIGYLPIQKEELMLSLEKKRGWVRLKIDRLNMCTPWVLVQDEKVVLYANGKEVSMTHSEYQRMLEECVGQHCTHERIISYTSNSVVVLGKLVMPKYTMANLICPRHVHLLTLNHLKLIKGGKIKWFSRTALGISLVFENES